jgi:hypothetical protein
MFPFPQNTLKAIGIAIYLICTSVTGFGQPPPTPNDDWTQARAQARKILGNDPIALLAEVDMGYARVTVKWAVTKDRVMIRKANAPLAKPKLSRLSSIQLRALEDKLRDPSLATTIQNLPSRSTVPPDSDYSILFVQIDKESVILRSWHPGAIAYISKKSHISEHQAAENLGPDYQPMIQCWAAIERIFKPILP